MLNSTSSSVRDLEGLLVEMGSDTYTVDLDDSQVTVSKADVQRVRPWHHMEVGDTAECKPDGQVCVYMYIYVYMCIFISPFVSLRAVNYELQCGSVSPRLIINTCLPTCIAML